MEMLKESGTKKTSTQRFSLFVLIGCTIWLVLVVGIYILRQDGIGQGEWLGMAAFVFLLLLGLGVNAGVKAYQKKFENIEIK